ncbi:hypothetical protein IJI69_03525 [Candidatus Saccharibacteria bacterium]|nr:hypothetical protein [Candidatus Saccharibacteria bacterium]
MTRKRMMNSYNIYGYGNVNFQPTFGNALSYAAELIRDHWKETGDLGECFAVVYDKLNHTRTIVWLTDDLKVKYRKLF